MSTSNNRRTDRHKRKGPSPQDMNVLVALVTRRRYPEAVALAKTMTVRFPEHGFAWKVLGTAFKQMGHGVAALAAMQKAATLSPSDAEVHFELGFALHGFGRRVEAEASYRRALQLKPDHVEAHNNLGLFLHAFGRLDEAEASYRRALQFKTDYAEAYTNLGNTLQAQGRLDEAEASYRRAVQIKPDSAQLHHNLGVALNDLGRLTEAEACYRRALQSNPDLVLAHMSLGNILQVFGRFDEAATSYRRALQIKPDFAEAYSNLLLNLNYDPNKHNESIVQAHQEYEARFAAPHRGKWPAYGNGPEPLATHGRLKVGYVSPDLRQHPVAHFIRPLLREHDPEAVEVFCYADVRRLDAVTLELQGLTDHWLSTVGLSDAEVADRIVADKIDILVDLAGHTANNRLQVFARKPASVQITWLGYPNTTGLSAIDYRLVDAVTDPPGEADRWACETLIRLDNGFLCYEPPADAPRPVAPPSLASGNVTFGSFNNLAKLSSATLGVWAKLLKRVPGSRLLVKGKGFNEDATNAAFLKILAQYGVDTRRVTLLGFVDSLTHHLQVYEQVDIALDPFPYNGTTTTCEALYMGVPVVTLMGDRHAGRVGASLLRQIGLPELIAPSVEGYIDVASDLAADSARQRALRQTMRERMRMSPLCDAQAFARKIEATYRDLWQRSHEAISNNSRRPLGPRVPNTEASNR